ncbi:MAG: InlB B-repeat-containing protein [Clostridia bacterium]|nr:InlB B-repeat-containing protein [Clostridia bacterium]
MRKILNYIMIALLTIVTLTSSLSLNVYAKDKGLTVKVEPECNYKLLIKDGLMTIDQEQLKVGKEYKLYVHKYQESDPYFVVDKITFETKDKNVIDISKYDVYTFVYSGSEVVTVRGHMDYPDKSKVTFNFDNAVCTSPSAYTNVKNQLSVSVPFGSNISLSNFNFERTGYDLVGYSINGENYSLNSTYGPIKDDIVIETRWEENNVPEPEKTFSLTILTNSSIQSSTSFVIKDESGNEVNDSSKLVPGKYYIETKNFDSNNNYLVLTSDGFDGNDVVNNPVEITNSDIVIYANALPKVSATFDVNGSLDIVSKIETCKGKAITLPSCNYNLTGYKFSGWIYDGVTYNTGDSFIMNDNAKFEASFTKCSYTNIVVNKDECVDKNYEIIFKYSDGKIVDLNNVLVGETIYAYLNDNFNSKKYTDFKVESDVDGVMKEVNLTIDKYSFITTDKNITFKIHMNNKKSFIIHFDANGGYGKMNDVTVNAGEDIDDIECEFNKNGYMFDGWEVDGKKVTNLIVTSDITLKATWKRCNSIQTSYGSNVSNTSDKNASSDKDEIKEDTSKEDIVVHQSTNYYSKVKVNDDEEIIEYPAKTPKSNVTSNEKIETTNIVISEDNKTSTNTNTNVVTSIDSTSNYSQAEEVVPTYNNDNYENESGDTFMEILSILVAIFISVTILTLFVKVDSNHENDIDEKY